MNGFILKPITESMIFDVVVEAFGQESTTRRTFGALEKEKVPEGFDTVRGARILLVEDNEINQKLYLKLLGRFVEQFSRFEADIQKLINENDLAGAQRMAHTLKGVAGYIGAVELQLAASDIEARLTHNTLSELPNHLSRVRPSLETVLTGIEESRLLDAVQTPDVVAAAGPVDPKALISSLEIVKTKVAKKKPKACKEKLEEIKRQPLPEAHLDDFKKLSLLLRSYKFKQADEIIDALIDHMKG